MASAGNNPAARFRVGDWVSLQYGPKRVLAQVVENRGRLGVRGRRLYRIRLDQDGSDSIEMPEEDLEPATEADMAARGVNEAMAVHQTLSYFGDEEDARGVPKLWYHYLVIASPGPRPGSGLASIISLSEARATGVAQASFHDVFARHGGPEAALAEAEEYLDSRHPGLKKIASDRKP